MATRKPRSHTGTRKPTKQFRWSHEMRVFLHVLHTDFKYDKSQNAVIFRSAFTDAVQRHGATDQRLEFLIKAQIQERNKMKAKTWTDICKTTVDPAEAKRREEIRSQIQEAAAAMTRPVTSRTSPAQVRSTEPSYSAHPALGTSMNYQINISGTRAAHVPTATPVNLTPLLLSEQTPIGTWAPVTPESGDEMEHTTPIDDSQWKGSTLRARALVPVIPRLPAAPGIINALMTPPKTTGRAARTDGSVPGKVLLRQANGSLIAIPADKHAAIPKTLKPVQEQEAHPPMNSLFFRYWAKDDTCGLNSDDGFIARKYFQGVNFTPTPRHCTDLDWDDLFNHLDRSGMQKKIHSPYISVSNSLIWTIRLALREGRENPGSQGRISVIDADRLPRQSVFYVPPYHRELKKTYEFTVGSWHYAGTHEFIVWKEIPKKAIIHTFAVRDLLRFVRHDETLRPVLRFDLLSVPGDLKTKVTPVLKRGRIGLTEKLVGAFARLASSMGFTSRSSIEHISNIVCELCQGWAIELVWHDDAQWNSLATAFTNALFAADTTSCNLRDETCIKRGFLDGVKFASSAHQNTRQSKEKLRLMYAQAGRIGLGDPGRSIVNELAAAQMAVISFEKRQKKALPGYKTQLLPEGPAQDEGLAWGDEMEVDDDGESAVAQPVVRRRPARRMMEQDEMQLDHHEEDTIVVEHGEDGRGR